MKKMLLALHRLPAERWILPILFIGMVGKNILLQSFICGSNCYAPFLLPGDAQLWLGILFTSFSLMLLFAPATLFKKEKNKLKYGLTISIVFLVFTLIDVCYYRCSPEMPSVSLLVLVEDATGQGHLTFSAITDTFSFWDFLFFLDYALVALLRILIRVTVKCDKESGSAQSAEPAPEAKKSRLSSVFEVKEGTKGFGRRLLHTRFGHFSLVLFTCLTAFTAIPLVGAFFSSSKVAVAYDRIYSPPFNKDYALYFTPVGYHLVDLIDTASTMGEEEPITPEKAARLLPQIGEYYDYFDTDLPESAYKGMYAGKNVILIQVESLESFPLGQTLNGKEITPRLNALIAKDASSMYFTQIYDQVKSGNSSDCDLMINTSLLPTTKVFFREYAGSALPSMPELLRENGYITNYFNGSGPHSVWPYEDVYGTTFGYDVKEGSPTQNFFPWRADDPSEKVYRYISDKENFARVLAHLKTLPEGTPSFAQVVLCSSHMPFTYIYDDIPEEELLLLPEEALRANETICYLNCLHYVDAQIGRFLDEAGEAGLLDNTVVLIYGDHAGIHKYYPNNARKTASLGEEYAFIEDSSFHTIPLIIYDPSGKTEHREVDTVGGQVDVMPTLLSLLGYGREYYPYAMGKDLLNTDRNYVILSNGTLIGDLDRRSDEYSMAYKAYKISDVMLQLNFFSDKDLPGIAEFTVPDKKEEAPSSSLS